MIIHRLYKHARFLLACTFVILITEAACASEISLGKIIMQLRSTADADTPDVTGQVANITSDYLNEYFSAYYTRTEALAKDYFSQATLSSKSFGVHGVEGSFITTIEFEGTLSFNSDTLPSHFFVETLLRNAFEGRNEELYLDRLLANDDEFLQNLSYLIIDINTGGKVSESPIKGHDKNATSMTNTTSSNNKEEPIGKNTLNPIPKWVIAAMSITIVIFAALVVSLIYYMHLRRKDKRRTRKSRDDNGDDNGDEPMKVIRLPVKKKNASSRPNSNTKTNNNNNIISPTSTATTLPSPANGTGTGRLSSFSPMKSLASSIYTNADNMSRFTNNNADNMSRITINDVYTKSPQMKDTYSKSSNLLNHSRFSLDVPSIDLGRWRGGRQDPPAFGSDISIIEKPKDLRLIPESDEDLEAGLRNKTRSKNFRSKGSSNRYMSRKSRVALDARHSKSRSSNRSEEYFYNGQNNDNDSDIGLSGTTNDVICDLNNLSMQIEQQRKSIRSKRSSRQ